ncbi:hypothetical protein FNO01nite_24890 [Flavobacterium noncentrifugens]|uniref:Por secretion system C-terminal sorting domain-containing protein n=1 Tax=Flavobacterium noncentrifugens TaxID=1128970 RepID=A0A1G8ZVB8_9FLAO|nr:T9SS type A sorting domain-containing protein [Flavobacterium noncentrifugens]GEP51817.1 hypothetical protein FNO01nite_24890 [Flavobacterium noncentrifugens]SDK19008.1 Por secretion system C-terminal sorting domain-containing protein [Flavobacterium noncentrifugens]
MKKQLLFAFLLAGSIFTATAQQETVAVTNRTFQAAYFGTAFNAGALHGVLTSIDVNVALTASTQSTYANDFTVLVTTGLTATDVITLQAGGFSDFAALETQAWPSGDSDVVGTVCDGTITLDTPIDFDANPTLKVYFGNGYFATGGTNSGTWNGSFTLNGVSTTLAVKDTKAATSFVVSPNPATSLITVSNEKSPITNVSITDLNGRIVKENAVNNLSKVDMNISDLSAGVYMMNIKSNEGTATKKIVKN